MEDVCCGCLGVGNTVPDFEIDTFEPSTGKFGKFSLSAAMKAGKWTILFFYPADFTFICPTELADLADKQEALKKMGCEVVSVSTDTKFVHYGWFHQEKLLENVKYHMEQTRKAKYATSSAYMRKRAVSPSGGLSSSIQTESSSAPRSISSM
jgi:alkyl hydroperoxide reductase subunit AhpC